MLSLPMSLGNILLRTCYSLIKSVATLPRDTTVYDRDTLHSASACTMATNLSTFDSRWLRPRLRQCINLITDCTSATRMQAAHGALDNVR